MKPGLILLLAFLSIVNQTIGQEKKGKIDIKSSVDYAKLGEGDYSGIYFTNSLLYSFSSGFQISGTIGFLNSSDDGSENIVDTHFDNHITGDILLKINPVEFGKFSMFFAFGGSVRHRSESRVISLFTFEGEIYPGYSSIVSYDLGYTGQAGIGFEISPRIMLILNGAMHTYNKGTSVASVGLGVNIGL